MNSTDLTLFVCRVIKPINNFYKAKSNKDGHHTMCKKCDVTHRTGPKYKARKRKVWINSTYKMSIESYNQMFIDQNESCAICKTHQSKLNKTLAIDHCHVTGKVRGLLCVSCNNALGLLKDSVERLVTAIDYLRK